MHSPISNSQLMLFSLINLAAFQLSPLLAWQAADVPARDSASPIMLAGPWLPENSHQLDFSELPKVPHAHVVISDVRAQASDPNRPNKQAGGMNQHNYLAHHAG